MSTIQDLRCRPFSRSGGRAARALLPVILAAALAVLAEASAANAAEVSAAKLDSVTKATSDFLAAARGSEKSGQPPRQSDPAVAAQLGVVFDTGDAQTPPPVPFDEIDRLNEWTLDVIKVGSVYMFAGTGIADLTKVDQGSDVAKLNEVITRNTVTFAPEMGQYIDAQLALTKALMESVMAKMAAEPAFMDDATRKAGLEKTQGGVTQALGGVLSVLPVDGLSDDWRLERLNRLIDVAPVAAKFVTTEQRQALMGLSLEQADNLKNADVADGLRGFAKAFTGP